MTWQEMLKENLESHRRKDAQGKVIADACDILGIKPENIAEVGVYKGGTTSILRDRFPAAQLHLIDPWQEQDMQGKMYRTNRAADWEQIYQDVCDEFEGCTIIRADSLTAAYMMQPESFDMVFLDGDHSYGAVKNDIAHWMPKVRNGGLLCGHDYSTRGANKGVKKAVDEFIGQDNIVVGSRKTWIHKVER